MSAFVVCCGVAWETAGSWSDALYQGQPHGGRAVGHSPDGKCGLCGVALLTGPIAFNPEQCGQPLCGKPTEAEAHVLGGPILYFCAPCASAFEAECKTTGVASKVTMRKAAAP